MVEEVIVKTDDAQMAIFDRSKEGLNYIGIHRPRLEYGLKIEI